MTTQEFYDNIANNMDYLRIEWSLGGYNKQIKDIDNVVGFIYGAAVVITDLDDKQIEYYRKMKNM